jgi:predicted phosphodiesterase
MSSSLRQKLFRIQYASDLHLELFKGVGTSDFTKILKPAAPYLALAGDIGHPKQWKSLLEWASPQWKQIFIVTGNHEYYNSESTKKDTMQDRDIEFAWLAGTHMNVNFLHPTSPSIFLKNENVAVIGSTLWTEVDLSNDAWKRVNDYHNIFVQPNKVLTPQDSNWMHAENRWTLELEIEKWRNRGANVCVITHHLPSYRLINPIYQGSQYNSCFAAKCDDLIRYPVRTWIYGHTHNASTISLGKRNERQVICCVNARGYERSEGKPEVAGYIPNAFIEFECEDPETIEEKVKLALSDLMLGGPVSPKEDIEFM